MSRLALGRIDLSRMQFSAEEQTNWMPRTLGSMMLRPGTARLGNTASDARALFYSFINDVDDTHALEFTSAALGIWVGNTPLVRASVDTAITNGDMASATGWTDEDETGASSSFAVIAGSLTLLGTGSTRAIRTQSVSVSAADGGVEHGLRVSVTAGPVVIEVGTTSGASDLLSTSLKRGEHSLAFTPPSGASTVYVRFSSRLNYTVTVTSCEVEASGVVALTSPYLDADLENIRLTQSQDVLFVSCVGYQPRRIERRTPRMWSLAYYETIDGPLRDENTSGITITPDVLNGDVTLTASEDLFTSTQAGGIWRLTSSGQESSVTVGAENQFTSPGIRVTGVADDRKFTVVASSTASTVTLQRAVGVDEASLYADVQTIASGATVQVDDGLDNQIIFYRVGVKTGDYTDAVTATITYSRGSISGYVRIGDVASATSATGVILSPLGGTAATGLWTEGEWSDFRGWPGATAMHEGRLYFAGLGKLWGSVVDAFDSFDLDFEGDGGTISKTIPHISGESVAWLSSGDLLHLGTFGGIYILKTNSLDEPVTPTNSRLRRFETTGALQAAPAIDDESVYYISINGQDIYQSQPANTATGRLAERMTALSPDIGGVGGFTRITVQNQPDTRVHCVRADGKVAILVTDPAEDVRCWVLFETDGIVEDVIVGPGSYEDEVFYLVRRVINGATVRIVEKWALEQDCQGEADSRLADSHVVYSGVATNTVTGGSHLEGETVVVWADGTQRDDAVVSSGSVAVSGAAATNVCFGLGYQARFKSTKLAYGAPKGHTPLTRTARISHVGLVLADVHAQGIEFGDDFEHLEGLPPSEGYETIDADAIHTDYDYRGIPNDGGWTTDKRLCLVANAPRPVTALAAVVDFNAS